MIFYSLFPLQGRKKGYKLHFWAPFSNAFQGDLLFRVRVLNGNPEREGERLTYARFTKFSGHKRKEAASGNEAFGCFGCGLVRVQ